MILFWDRNIGKGIPQALLKVKPAGIDIRYYAEVFQGLDNTKENGDDGWLAIVGELGWVVITQDYNYHENPAELRAIRQHNVGCFYLWGATATRWEKLRCFFRAYDNIIYYETKTPKPFIYDITQRGSLRQIL